MVNDFRPFKGAMAKLSPHAKGVEVVDSQGKTTVEEVDLAVDAHRNLTRRAHSILTHP
jgi:type I restriction enzyme R subunit